MPTGFTADIIDGKITAFEQFAKKCMRAFGAAMHMREDSLGAEYIPATVDDYHLKELKNYQERLDKVNAMSDEEIVNERSEELNYLINLKKETLAKMSVDKERLIGILNKVETWTPPTESHEELKTFMMKQIVETIDWDCDPKYSEEALVKSKDEIQHLNADIVRREMIDKIKWNINYHTEGHEKQIKRVEEANKWVEDLFKSLEA